MNQCNAAQVAPKRNHAVTVKTSDQRATVVIGKDGKAAWVKVEPDITKERDFAEVEAVLVKLTK